jgi:SAM-dependent methyltransferase
MEKFKALTRQLTCILRRNTPKPVAAGVQGVDWYNDAYATTPEYWQHYTQSSYYFLWTVLADRICRSGVQKILDVGCGPGQFASLLRDKGIKHYFGVDFSSTCIALARQACPSFEFAMADLAANPFPQTFAYDCAVILEFLEHIPFDREIIQRIRPGTKVFATVPNFPYTSHVRHFTDEEEVAARYRDLFMTGFSVTSFFANPQGKTFFLMEGIRS